MGERPYWWGAAARMIYDKPIFGIGGGRFKEEYKFFKPSESIDTPDHAHNVYLQLASEYGIFALLAFLSIIILAFRAVIQACHSCENRFDLGLAMGIFAALISWCVYGLVDNTLHRRTALFFWFVLGILGGRS
jgi:O-antigen ligase